MFIFVGCTRGCLCLCQPLVQWWHRCVHISVHMVLVHELWLLDAIWWHRTESTSACLVATSNTGTNIALSSLRPNVVHLWVILQEAPQPPLIKTSLNVIERYFIKVIIVISLVFPFVFLSVPIYIYHYFTGHNIVCTWHSFYKSQFRFDGNLRLFPFKFE